MFLDLIIGFYHTQLSKDTSNICAIYLHWGKYRYISLPMRDSNSPEISQQKINYLFQGFELIHAYRDDHLIFTKCDWIEHVQKLELILTNLNKVGLTMMLTSVSLVKLKWVI